MEMREKNLVILAAGIGSRFKGGIKQLQPVGPAGECIMEYSIYDALEAGFNRVVFIIRREIEPLFNEAIGDRLRRICQARGVEMVCVYQDLTDLPGGLVCPEGRTKPWGTGHALLSCRGALHGGFAVINADDFYGKEAYRLMSEFLDDLPQDSQGVYGLAGFRLGNTLSDNGGVTRGLCRTDDDGMLAGIRETKHLVPWQGGAGVRTDAGVDPVDADTPVSMNLWAFTPDVLDRLQEQFLSFLTEGGLTAPDSEFLIPIQIGGMIADGQAKVRVLPTGGKWFGMTYADDTPAVRSALAQMTEQGLYPRELFPEDCQ